MQDFINQVEAFWQPYLISQIASVIILLVSFWHTRIARGIFSLLFLWASLTNLYTIFTSPDSYLEYANLAIPLYRDFIEGWFSHNHQIIVPLIACGQFIIGLGMLLKNPWLKWACVGAIIFLLSIAPLMVGSAFPFSITVSIAAWLVLRNDKGNFLWKSVKPDTN